MTEKIFDEKEKTEGVREDAAMTRVTERCRELMEKSLSAADRLEKLGELSGRLADAIGAAMDDPAQFNRFIVAEKAKNRDGEPVTESVEKVFGKVDFKSMKEAAGAIRAVADSVKSVYSVPAFSELSGVCSGPDGDPDGVVVTFESGLEYAT